MHKYARLRRSGGGGGASHGRPQSHAIFRTTQYINKIILRENVCFFISLCIVYISS